MIFSLCRHWTDKVLQIWRNEKQKHQSKQVFHFVNDKNPFLKKYHLICSFLCNAINQIPRTCYIVGWYMFHHVAVLFKYYTFNYIFCWWANTTQNSLEFFFLSSSFNSKTLRVTRFTTRQFLKLIARNLWAERSKAHKHTHTQYINFKNFIDLLNIY